MFRLVMSNAWIIPCWMHWRACCGQLIWAIAKRLREELELSNFREETRDFKFDLSIREISKFWGSEI